MSDPTPADYLALLLIRLARLRGEPPEPFVLAALNRIDPDPAVLMLDDLAPEAIDRATRGVKAAIAKYRPQTAIEPQRSLT